MTNNWKTYCLHTRPKLIACDVIEGILICTWRWECFSHYCFESENGLPATGVSSSERGTRSLFFKCCFVIPNQSVFIFVILAGIYLILTARYTIYCKIFQHPTWILKLWISLNQWNVGSTIFILLSISKLLRSMKFNGNFPVILYLKSLSQYKIN